MSIPNFETFVLRNNSLLRKMTEVPCSAERAEKVLYLLLSVFRSAQLWTKTAEDGNDLKMIILWVFLADFNI